MNKNKSKKPIRGIVITTTKTSLKEPEGGIGGVYAYNKKEKKNTQDNRKRMKDLKSKLEKKESKVEL